MSTDTDVQPDDDLDLDLDDSGAPDDEQPIELTREQALSRMTLRELQQICKSPEYNLSAQGKTTELIARIIKFEEEGLVDGDLPKSEALKPGVTPTIAPVDPGPAARADAPERQPRDRFAGLTRESERPGALAPTGGRPPKQKVGFFEGTNMFRAEFPLGPRAQIDDPTHYQFIEDTHTAAREAGYATKGAPFVGLRVGFSVIRTEQGPIRSVIYEVSARQED